MKILLLVVILLFGCEPKNSEKEWKSEGWIVDLFESNRHSDVLYYKVTRWDIVLMCDKYARKMDPTLIESTIDGIRHNEIYCCSERSN